MNEIDRPSDVLFCLKPDGTLALERPNEAPQPVTLDELTAVAIAGTEGVAGTSAQGLTRKLASLSPEVEWAGTVAKLVEKGALPAFRQLVPTARKSAPALVVSAGHSGSGLLQRILGRLPGLFCPALDDLPLRAAHWLAQPELDADSRALRLGNDWVSACWFTYLQSLWSGAAKKVGKSRLLQFAVPRPGRGVDAFDNLTGGKAVYVFLVRNGLDFVEVAARALRSEEPNPQRDQPLLEFLLGSDEPLHLHIARYWAKTHLLLLDFRRRNPDRVALLRYEELVKHPRRVVDEVLAFLGEQQAEHAIAAAIEDGMAGEHHAIAEWKSWPRPVIQEIEPIVDEVLFELGYPSTES